MTVFSDDVLMLNAAQMEEWYEQELIMRAENELRQKMVGGSSVYIPSNPLAIPNWVGAIPAEYNMVNGQNFALNPSGAPGGWFTPAQTLVLVKSNQPAPDGTATASKLTDDLNFSTHFLSHQVQCATTNNEMTDIPMRIQLIAQAAEHTRILLQVVDEATADQVSACIDLKGGRIGFDNTATNWTIQSATMTQPFTQLAAAGWWLITFEFTVAGPNAAAFTTLDVRIFLDNASGTVARSLNFQGNGFSGVNLWYCVFLPKAAWNFTGEVFRDDFTSLSTIDLLDTRTPNFNWYTHLTFPNTTQPGACWGTAVPPPPSVFSQSGSILTIARDAQASCGMVLTSAAADPHNPNNVVTGFLMKPPFIYEASQAYDPTIQDDISYSGTHPAIWCITTAIGTADINQAVELDVTDGTSGAPSLPRACTNFADHFLNYMNNAGCRTAGLTMTDFRKFSVMMFPATGPTNNHGLCFCFGQNPADTRNINNFFAQQGVSKHFDTNSFANCQNYSYMLILGAGLGTWSGSPVTPIGIPVSYDYVRVIK